MGGGGGEGHQFFSEKHLVIIEFRAETAAGHWGLRRIQ